jgi:hypothetical protein
MTIYGLNRLLNRLEPLLSGFKPRAIYGLGSAQIWLRLGSRAVSSQAVTAVTALLTVVQLGYAPALNAHGVVKVILDGISSRVEPGQLLAVLGQWYVLSSILYRSF